MVDEAFDKAMQAIQANNFALRYRPALDYLNRILSARTKEPFHRLWLSNSKYTKGTLALLDLFLKEEKITSYTQGKITGTRFTFLAVSSNKPVDKFFPIKQVCTVNLMRHLVAGGLSRQQIDYVTTDLLNKRLTR